ncbi:hypothetical protein Tco_0369984, partial [Tanacetum coccineum]
MPLASTPSPPLNRRSTFVPTPLPSSSPPRPIKAPRVRWFCFTTRKGCVGSHNPQRGAFDLGLSQEKGALVLFIAPRGALGGSHDPRGVRLVVILALRVRWLAATTIRVRLAVTTTIG